MNNITSVDLLSKVNPRNRQLLNDFIDYLHSVQRSEATIDGYKNDIEIAWVWCLQYNENAFYCDWTKRQLVRYQNWLLNDNGNSPARIRRLKASLSSLGNFIESVLDDEFPNFRNIINKIESPVNQPVRIKTIFTDEQINELLNKLVEKQKYDKACALALALYSGRRKAEIVRFKVSDFSEERLVCNGALYKSAPIKTKGRGKAGKPMECFCLAKKFRPYLDLWLNYRKQVGINSEWLFPDLSDTSKQMSISKMTSWARSFTKTLGVDFYWHAMRHMTVTNFKRAGIPDTVIQQYIGWADISMVPVYSDMQADEQLGMYFNEDGIVIPESKSLSDI
jgi:site-specific recombinase XerD